MESDQNDSEEMNGHQMVTSTVKKANVPQQPNLTQVERDENDLTEKISEIKIIEKILQDIIDDLEKASRKLVQQTNSMSQRRRQRNEIFDFNRAMFNAENVNNHFNITRLES